MFSEIGPRRQEKIWFPEKIPGSGNPGGNGKEHITVRDIYFFPFYGTVDYERGPLKFIATFRRTV
jgi:hypothetical protein